MRLWHWVVTTQRTFGRRRHSYWNVFGLGVLLVVGLGTISR
jgi:hypothetical protein